MKRIFRVYCEMVGRRLTRWQRRRSSGPKTPWVSSHRCTEAPINKYRTVPHILLIAVPNIEVLSIVPMVIKVKIHNIVFGYAL